MALTTVARVRSLAGLRPKWTTGDVLGVGNGTNIVFAPHAWAFFSSIYNDTVQKNDVRVYVNGSIVGVASITENAVILSSPPAGDAKVTADYFGSNISNSELMAFISEVDAQLIGMFHGVYTPEALASSPVMRKISTYLSAASVSDQGFMTAGNPSAGMYPPDRLRAVANDLLQQVLNGSIALVDDYNNELIEVIERWIASSSYDAKDRVFEFDPFNVDSFGKPVVEKVRTPFDWS